MLTLNGRHAFTDELSVQANSYVRYFRQHHVDGNVADIERCSNASSFPNRLCLEDDGFPRPTPVTQVRADAAEGVSMPPKSTYFFPKVITGMLFNPLDDPR